MRHIDLEKLDMMSLIIIVNLCEHKSATQVSKILNIPQSKISRCLRNARSVFGNELFCRKKYGLIPNDYTKSIYPIAKEIVEQAQRFNQLGVNTATRERWFEIAVPGLISYLYPKALMHSVKAANKHFHLNFNPWNANTLQGITDGEVSLGVCCGNQRESQALIEQNFHVESLKVLDSLYLIANKNHPLFEQDITLEAIASYPFIKTEVGCNPHNPCPFEEFCHGSGIPLTIELCISSVSSLFTYLESSDAVCLVPYKSIYDVLEEMPALHGCCLSARETTRMFTVADPKSIELISCHAMQDEELSWLKQQLHEITSSLV